MNTFLKRQMKAFAGAVLLTLSLAGVSHAYDPFEGEWGSTESCAEGTQCWLDIARDGAEYEVVYLAADRLDASKVLCRVASRMSRGPIRYSPHETYDDGLSGLFQGSNAYLAPVADGSVIMGGGLTAGLACDQYHWPQIYFPLGDY